MKACRHFVISGRVQGVFYRDCTQQTALNLGLTGYVKNLPNGHVEIEVCGERSGLDEIHQWLWKGPILSEVTDIQVHDIALVDYLTFNIIY